MALFKTRLFSGKQESLSKPHPFSDLPLILASGLGRSGTTVLRHCLAAHSRSASQNEECNYIHDLIRAADTNLDNKNHLKTLPVSQDSYWQLHRQLLLNLYWPVDQLENMDQPRAISTYSMLDPRAAIGLKKAFPNLVVCYIIRNGIEVVSSYQSFPAFKHLEFEAVCQLWALRHDMFKYQAHQRHFFLFRFEWFQQPDLFQNQLEAALKFAGLEFEPRCMEPLKTKFHPTTFAGESPNAAKEMTARRDRWTLWNDQQRDLFATICGPAMKSLGYEILWQ